MSPALDLEPAPPAAKARIRRHHGGPAAAAPAKPRRRLGPALALSAIHLAALMTLAWYVATFFPSEHVLAWTMAGCGVVAELVALIWRRMLVAQIMAVGLPLALLLVFQIPWSEGHLTWHAWICMGMASLVLIPSRATWLMWLVPSIGVELLFLALTAGGGEVHNASRVLIPLALCALAANAWFVALAGARATIRHRAPLGAALRWALIPAAVAALFGMGLGGHFSWAEYRPAPQVPGDEANVGAPGGQLLPSVGTSSSYINDKDTTVAARLAWEHPPADFSANNSYYLRALCFDTLYLDGDELKWRNRDGTPSEVPGTLPPGSFPAWVLRMPGGGDVVFRPDDGGAVELPDMVGDREGNLFRNGLGTIQRAYRVALDGGGAPPGANKARNDSVYTQLPREINAGWPWDRIESGTVWPQLPPTQAAVAVKAALIGRCTYSTDLPKPAAGPGGAFRTFLFGQESDRRGHCQFFATAEAVLLRRAHIPCRCVVGFCSHESDLQGVTFRALHAHAWIEVPDAQGNWQRIDPTPDSSHPQTPIDDPAIPLPQPPDIDPLHPPKPPMTDEDPGEILAQVDPHWWWWGGGAVAGLIVIVVVARALRRRRDPRRAVLERRADDLANLARALGITVSPATTVSHLAREVGKRTGIDLTPQLAAHLAARYGTGTVPPPWPLAELRAAARKK